MSDKSQVLTVAVINDYEVVVRGVAALVFYTWRVSDGLVSEAQQTGARGGALQDVVRR